LPYSSDLFIAFDFNLVPVEAFLVTATSFSFTSDGEYA
jgi:hypothetical protein